MRSIFIITCCLILSSCSIKEDRKNCPCLLQIDLREAHRKLPDEDLHIWFTDENTLPVCPDLLISSSEDQIEVKVPKKEIKTFVSTKSSRWAINLGKKALQLTSGVQSDSIYTYHNIVECMGERARDTVKLHKQWCTARILSKEPQKWETSLFEISSDWSGLAMDQIKGVRGPFSCQLPMNKQGEITIRIPRQGDNSLIMKIKTPLPGGKRMEEKTIPLGKMISSLGYDWNKLDLDDLTITLEMPPTHIRIEIEDWQEESTDVEY